MRYKNRDYTVADGNLHEANKKLRFWNNNNQYFVTYYTADKSLRNTGNNAHLTHRGINT